MAVQSACPEKACADRGKRDSRMGGSSWKGRRRGRKAADVERQLKVSRGRRRGGRLRRRRHPHRTFRGLAKSRSAIDVAAQGGWPHPAKWEGGTLCHTQHGAVYGASLRRCALTLPPLAPRTRGPRHPPYAAAHGACCLYRFFEVHNQTPTGPCAWLAPRAWAPAGPTRGRGGDASCLRPPRRR